MATFVLVHGASHGGRCWRKVTPIRRAAGHEFHHDVVNVRFHEDLRGVLLVGRGDVGGAVAGVADRADGRLAQLVCVDGVLPDDAESVLDLFDPATGAAWEERVHTLGERWRVQLHVATTPRTYGVTDPADARRPAP
jgi:hypothetical protein